MKILVTGGSGFIGSHVVDKLIGAGHEVRVFDLKEPHREDVEFSQGNIISKHSLTEGLKDIEVVYHIAAFSNIDLVKDNPLTTIEYNILGTAYLLEECRRQEVKRFILASTVYIYSNKGHLYSTSKITSELLSKNYYTLYSLPYTILRCGTAYGPRSRGEDVISLFVRNALKGENLVIRGSGKQKRHFIYVEDLALGCLAALKPEAENKAYTLAGKEPVSIKELAQIVAKIFNSKIVVQHSSDRGDDYQGEVLELDKAKRELGWEPKVDLEEGIRRYIEWYKETCLK